MMMMPQQTQQVKVPVNNNNAKPQKTTTRGLSKSDVNQIIEERLTQMEERIRIRYEEQLQLDLSRRTVPCYVCSTIHPPKTPCMFPRFHPPVPVCSQCNQEQTKCKGECKKCFYCKQFGFHIAADCPKKRENDRMEYDRLKERIEREDLQKRQQEELRHRSLQEEQRRRQREEEELQRLLQLHPSVPAIFETPISFPPPLKVSATTGPMLRKTASLLNTIFRWPPPFFLVPPEQAVLRQPPPSQFNVPPVEVTSTPSSTSSKANRYCRSWLQQNERL